MLGPIRLRRVSDRIPIFHVDGQDNSEAFAIGPFQWISVRDWNEVVMHNGVSLYEKPEVKRCSEPASSVKPIPRPWRFLAATDAHGGDAELSTRPL